MHKRSKLPTAQLQTGFHPDKNQKQAPPTKPKEQNKLLHYRQVFHPNSYNFPGQVLLHAHIILLMAGVSVDNWDDVFHFRMLYLVFGIRELAWVASMML